MKIKIDTSMMTTDQWEWVLANVRQEYAFGPDDIRMCVTFEHPDGIEHAHREIEVREWVRVITELHALSVTYTVEALLTPDALPDVWVPYGN